MVENGYRSAFSGLSTKRSTHGPANGRTIRGLAKPPAIFDACWAASIRGANTPETVTSVAYRRWAKVDVQSRGYLPCVKHDAGSVADMQDAPISIVLPDPLFRAARDIAGRRGVSVDRLIVDALNAEVARAYRKARSPVRADERYIAMLRARFAGAFAFARAWPDLQERLAARDAELREAGGGLALFSLSTGERLCKASDVGFSLRKLSIRFQAPFPGPRPRHGLRPCEPDEIELIEPF